MNACRIAALRGIRVALFVLGLAGPVAAGERLESTYEGAFVLSFGTGPQGTNDLWFAGTGEANILGPSLVLGHTTTRADPDNPLGSIIVTDQVVLVDAWGDELWLVNSGEEFLDPTDPNHLLIRGTGTFVVAGGTGRYRKATGSGEFIVIAEVLRMDPGGAWVAGSFQLQFTGDVVRRGH